MSINLYKILGVRKNAKTEDIRKAFRQLAKTKHPDQGGNAIEFNTLKEAEAILTDPARRKRYDETGRIDESRITPQRIKQFLAGTFEGVIKAQDDIASVDVNKKLIQSIENGCRQAYAQKDETERKMARTRGLMKRFKKKGESVLHDIMNSKLSDLQQELNNSEDAIELAKQSIELLKSYKYAVDPTTEGPLAAGPTFTPPRYGGRSSIDWIPTSRP